MSDDAAPEAGACHNCGFLCRHDIQNVHLPSFGELPREDREHQRHFTLSGWNVQPWCFRDVPILKEIGDLGHFDVPARSNLNQEE